MAAKRPPVNLNYGLNDENVDASYEFKVRGQVNVSRADFLNAEVRGDLDRDGFAKDEAILIEAVDRGNLAQLVNGCTLRTVAKQSRPTASRYLAVSTYRACGHSAMVRVMKMEGLLIASAMALVLSGCAGSSPPSEVSLADACSQYTEASAAYPNSGVELTSRYFLSVEEGLNRYISVADRVTAGLKSVDALAASQFAELKSRAMAAKIVAHRVGGGDLDISDSDIQAINAMQDAMTRLTDLCGSEG